MIILVNGCCFCRSLPASMLLIFSVFYGLTTYGAGQMRDFPGSYSVPFVTAGFLCLFAAVMAMRIVKSGRMGI